MGGIKRLAPLLLAAFGASALAAQEAPNAPLLDPVFGEHAVLQRQRPIRFWGEAAPNAAVKLVFAGEARQVRANKAGKWTAEFAAREAATGLTLDIDDDAGRSLHLADLSVGDVFLCSGQSNMVLSVGRSLNAQRELRSPLDKDIRILRLPPTAAAGIQPHIPAGARWIVPDPNYVEDFAAACMFFGRNVVAAKHVPVGLIHSAWGGSQIEAWMGAPALRRIGGFDAPLDLAATFARERAAGYALAGRQWEDWWKRAVSPTDTPWTASPADIAALKVAPTHLGDWKYFGDPALTRHAGMVWFYRAIELSARQAGDAREIRLGEIGETGAVWINGRFVGASGGGERSIYALPAGLLRSGANMIAIGAAQPNPNVDAGLLGPAEAMALAFDGGPAMPLAGGWRYSVVENRRAVPPRLPWDGRLGITGIYNAMIAPIGPLPLKGVVWYQGESNVLRAGAYKALLQGMIADWRRQFGADLPFVIVQIANYGAMSAVPEPEGSPRIREAQRQVVAEDPRTALVVTIDIGEKSDIHPPTKQLVAAREMQAARAVFYGEKVVPSGPIPREARIADSQVVIPFTDIAGRLISASAGRPFPFLLCGADGKCDFADASLSGDTVSVAVPAGVTPVSVRYCWDRAPICNLFDTSQAPAGPFELKVIR